MTFGLFFMSLFKDVEKIQETLKSPKKFKSPILVPVVEPSPRTKERLRKVQSEEDFMKVQVPWIL